MTILSFAVHPSEKPGQRGTCPKKGSSTLYIYGEHDEMVVRMKYPLIRRLTMNLAVFGASGPTGQLVTKQALASGHRVTAVTRHPETFGLRHEHLQVLCGDVFDLT